MNKNREAIMEYFSPHSNLQPKKDLSAFAALMNALGNPQKQYKSIHVVGTNGKGSTSTFIANALIANGFHVGHFTSPALVMVNERMCCDGYMIDDDELITMIEKVQIAEESLSIEYTGFDRMTACAMLWFAEKNVDYAVIEAGIGGRIDDTNIIESEISVITAIDYDHMATLGNTLEEIATEKAAVIKQGQRCAILHPQHEEVMSVLLARCKEMHVLPVLVSDCQMNVERAEDYEQDCTVRFPNGVTIFQHISMMGEFQLHNATACLLLAQALHLDMVRTTQAIEHTMVPGRLELLDGVPAVLLDGGHNPQAIEQITKAVQTFFGHIYVVLICSIMEDKDIPNMVEKFSHITDYVIPVAITERSAKPDILLEHFQKNEVNGHIAKNYQSAFVDALAISDKLSDDALVLVAGSLYLVGGFRSFLLNE